MRYFHKRMRSTRFLLVSAAVGIVVLAGGAVAAATGVGYPTDSVTVETGCLTTSGTGSGNIVNVSMGSNPAKACGSNQKAVHLSGGTITQVTAGNGLTTAGSGGTGPDTSSINNGFATLGLLPSFALPQGCGLHKFPDWGGSVADGGSGIWGCGTDHNTTYGAGMGLDLSSGGACAGKPDCGGFFSIEPAYQLPQTGCASGQFVASDGSGGWSCQSQTTYDGTNFATSDQGCPAGKFATGVNASGHLTCAQPSLDDLKGSDCPVGGATGSMQINTDSTTGAVSMTCQVYTVTGQSNSLKNVIEIYDITHHVDDQICQNTTSCSSKVAAGDQVDVFFRSGDENSFVNGHPFTLDCNGQGSGVTYSSTNFHGGVSYFGWCPGVPPEALTINSDYTASAS